jgi:hypothetical protein
MPTDPVVHPGEQQAAVTAHKNHNCLWHLPFGGTTILEGRKGVRYISSKIITSADITTLALDIGVVYNTAVDSIIVKAHHTFARPSPRMLPGHAMKQALQSSSFQLPNRIAIVLSPVECHS